MRRALRRAAAILLFLVCTPAARAQGPRKVSFRAVNYDVTAALLLQQHSLSAHAVVTFEAVEPSALLDLELHRDLGVQNVSLADGRPLHFDRDSAQPMHLTVSLPQTVVPGQKFSLIFDYAGPLINDEVSPVRGVRLAYIGDDSAILLRAGRWFPLAEYPGGQYTGNFNLITDEKIVVVGTGEADPPQKRTIVFQQAPPSKPGETKAKPDAANNSTTGLVYSFHVKKPEAAGSFLAGTWKTQTADYGGVTVTMFGPPAALADPKLADGYAQSVGGMMAYYSSEFGPLERTHMVVGQLAQGSLVGYSAPGFLLLGPREWDPQRNGRALSQLVAAQWFGNSVQAASADDVWITDGLARYAEALFLDNTAGREALDLALEDFSVGALMYEQSAPIAHASELKPFTPEYRSVVQNKGAVVYHMLRAQMGDAAFTELLHQFYKKYAGHEARLDDFETMAMQVAEQAATRNKPAPNLTAFFSQWLNSTGVPEFKLNYVVVRLRKGFAVRGTIRQDLETFSMPVTMKISTEGNPETKTVQVTGIRTDFNVETFGRPKPLGVVIDPNNELLKSSPKLRLRSLIARGEEDAQRGDFYNAIQEYQRAIDVQRNSSLAHFRMGEAAFYQKNYQAAASAFREALDGDVDPKWTEVWSHIYIGKIYDLSGLRDRAMNEYSKARETRDDTGGAQQEVARYSAQPFKLAPANPGNRAP